MTDRRTELIDRVWTAFQSQYGETPHMLVAAPGRVNLIGEHCDYNDGFVLPMAIDYETIVAIGSSSDDQMHIVAADYADATDQFNPNDAFEAQADDWKNHIRGSAAVLRDKGHQLAGANIAIAGNVPRGAGLSSSASLGVAMANVLAEFNAIGGLSKTDFALMAKQAENDFVGTACGIMDQLVSAEAKSGSALLIDCRTLETTPVSIPAGWGVVVIHSGVERQLANSPFNERREQCEAAARHYGVTALRDVSLQQLTTGRGQLDEAVFRRARHAVTEIARTEASVKAFADKDMLALSALMADSHKSLRYDFEVTVPLVDQLVDMIANEIGESGGVRMTGGGFGGCIVAILPREGVPDLLEFVDKNYTDPRGKSAISFICTPSSGVSIL